MTPRLWTLEDASLIGPRRPRIEAASFEILTGRTAILGESGSGKTSLLNLLVGFEKPDRGRVEFHRTNGSRLPLFWSPVERGLWPHVSKLAHLTSVSPESDKTTARDLLEQFDLQSTASDRVDDLSAGEKSRLSVARALAADANVLVLDEPLAHVEPARLAKYWSVIRTWCEAHGTSLVFTSHQPEIVLAHAERVVCLKAGRVVWQGEVGELYERPPSEAIGWSLGPINWFEPDDAATWLQREEPRAFGVRPDRLAIDVTPDERNAATIESVQKLGLTEHVTLRHDSGRRRLFHRVASPNSLAAGTRVVLRTLSLCLAVFLLGGCGGDEDGPAIAVQSIEIWNIPSEGVKVPTPRGLHVPVSGDLMVLDDAGRLLIYDDKHQLKHKWWMPEYTVGRPEGLWQMLDGRIAIADTHYHRVVMMNPDGTVESMFGEEGMGPGQFIFPETLVQDPDGSLYVCEYGGNDRIQKFTADGTFDRQFGSCGTDEGQFQRPTGLVWYDHKIYICDAVNNRVQEFTDDGEFVRVVADAQTVGLYYPYDMAVSPEGELYVVEFGSGRVTKLSREGKLLGRYGEQGHEIGKFSTPWGVAVSDNGRLFVADTGNRRLVELRL